jgi:diadenosine tetraphosphate (Ap4A) HIT family hydrolase
LQKFVLHHQLNADTRFVADWALSRVLLMNDARFPWLILVPRRASANELHDLLHAERMVLMEEIARAGKGLLALTGAAKINVGALGNIVPQLHVHVVARTQLDVAWPEPVWGQGTAIAYEAEAREALVAQLRQL